MVEHILSNGLIGAIIGAFTGFLTLPLIKHYLERYDAEPTSHVQSNALVNGIYLIGLIFFGGFAGLILILDMELNLTKRITLTLGFLILALSSGFFLFDALSRRIEWNENGFSLQRWHGPTMRRRWDQILAIEWDSTLQIWRIYLNSGDIYAFHPLMSGAKHFLEIASQRANLHIPKS